MQACTILATVLGPTTTGLAARLGVANIPSLKNPLSYITFRAGNSSFVARMPISGTFGCVSQGTAHATVLLSGTVDSARGPAFTSGDAVTVFIQLKNINGVVQVDVKDVSKGSTFTFVGPLNFGSAILIK